MNIEFVFAVLNISVLPAWALLIVAPRWKWTFTIVHGVWIVSLLCVSWIGIFILKPEAPQGSGFLTLEQFMLFLSTPSAGLLVWVQLLMWDLFVGAWIARDGVRRDIHRGTMAVILVVFLLIPPAGLLAYFILRYVSKRVLSLEESIGLSIISD